MAAAGEEAERIHHLCTLMSELKSLVRLGRLAMMKLLWRLSRIDLYGMKDRDLIAFF